MNNCQPQWDLDLSFGKAGEEWLRTLMDTQTHCDECGATWKKFVEVKRERDRWKETGNLFFEFEYRGKPSGIAATKAHWWFIILTVDERNEGVLGFPVNALRKRLRALHQTKQARIVDGGDFNRAKGLIVPMATLESLWQ
tara:strand:- start:698 stop:1117 length:420 start_codon:yes stop_codon:yes gene_type:complete